MLTTLATTLTLLPTALAAEPIDLKHTFVADQTRTYTMKANAALGQEIVVTGEIALKLGELKEPGAKAELSMPDFGIMIDGSDAGGMVGTPEALSTELDKFGMPAELRTQNAEFLFVLFAVANYLPSESIEVGGEFKVDWKTADKSLTVTGKGELVELTEKDGRQVAKLRKRLNVSPDPESPGDLDMACEVWADTGELISANGSITIESGEVTFSFDAKPAVP